MICPVVSIIILTIPQGTVNRRQTLPRSTAKIKKTNEKMPPTSKLAKIIKLNGNREIEC